MRVIDCFELLNKVQHDENVIVVATDNISFFMVLMLFRLNLIPLKLHIIMLKQCCKGEENFRDTSGGALLF